MSIAVFEKRFFKKRVADDMTKDHIIDSVRKALAEMKEKWDGVTSDII